MDKAFRCPKCGAQVLLDQDVKNTCCFCMSELTENDRLEKVDWGYYAKGFSSKLRLTSYKCLECKKEQYVQDPSIKPTSCAYCGSQDILPNDVYVSDIPLATRKVAFKYSREDAVAEFRKAVKGPKLLFGSGKEMEKAIVPVYVPCFAFDYKVYASAVLSVVPVVKNAYKSESKGLAKALFYPDEVTFEVTSRAIQPYPKNFSSEMVWSNIPVCASTSINDEVFEQISPFSLRVGQDDPQVEDLKDATFLIPDRDFESVEQTLLKEVKEWVKECAVVSHIDNYTVTSFVDNSEYDRGLGSLIYLPVWQMKYRKKNACYTWYMNAASGEPSELKYLQIAGEEKSADEQTDPLKNSMKKRIKKIKAKDISDDYDLNYRSYMVDNFAVTIAMNSELEGATADKAMIQLERGNLKRKIEISVPDMEESFDAGTSEMAEEAKKHAIPSAPVPLPEEHSQLFMMKEAVRTRSLGKGERLPQKPLDRRVGNEDQFVREDTHESLAVEFGLADLPEYDPTGPSPFKKS